jgi:hypothetical protein
MDDFPQRVGGFLLFTFLAALGLACSAGGKGALTRITAAGFGIIGVVGMVCFTVSAVQTARRRGRLFSAADGEDDPAPGQAQGPQSAGSPANRPR